MGRYMVTFMQEWSYEVEANDEGEAEELAYREFESEMCKPVARTHYDYVEVNDIDDPWNRRDF